jgi:TusA-related sulfurtransferase
MEEKLSKEIEIMKKVEILEIKTSISQIKTTVDSIISR